MQNLLILFNLVAPVFIIVAVGYILKITKVIDEGFVKIANKLVFNLALPSLIFLEIATRDFTNLLDYKLIVFSYIGSILAYIICWIVAYLYLKKPEDRASFIQGGFRSNYAIIGLALISSVFGSGALAKASLILAFTIPLYNILAVIALTYPLNKNKSAYEIMIELIKNPLIISVILATPFSLFRIELPLIMDKTIGYITGLTLPLALIGIGGYLDFKDFKVIRFEAFGASAMKLIMMPLVGTWLSIIFGFRGMELGILFILFATPAAVASFVMADAMGCNSRLAANILLITTLFSILTITFGLFILKEINYI